MIASTLTGVVGINNNFHGLRHEFQTDTELKKNTRILSQMLTEYLENRT